MSDKQPLLRLVNSKNKGREAFTCVMLGILFSATGIFLYVGLPKGWTAQLNPNRVDVSSLLEKQGDPFFLAVALGTGIFAIRVGIKMFAQRNIEDLIVYEGELDVAVYGGFWAISRATPKRVSLPIKDVLYYSYNGLDHELTIKTKGGMWYRISEWSWQSEEELTVLLKILSDQGIEHRKPSLF